MAYQRESPFGAKLQILILLAGAMCTAWPSAPAMAQYGGGSSSYYGSTWPIVSVSVTTSRGWIVAQGMTLGGVRNRILWRTPIAPTGGSPTSVQQGVELDIRADRRAAVCGRQRQRPGHRASRRGRLQAIRTGLAERQFTGSRGGDGARRRRPAEPECRCAAGRHAFGHGAERGCGRPARAELPTGPSRVDGGQPAARRCDAERAARTAGIRPRPDLQGGPAPA